MGQNKSIYLADDVLEYLSRHANASAEVNRLVRLKIARDAEAAAYERAHGVQLTEERRAHARSWVREQMAAAAERAAESRDAREAVRRQMGWTT